MNFDQAKEFFKSWGLYPHDEDTDDLNQEVIRQGINARCYEKMLNEAQEKHGGLFAEYCRKAINAQDDAFFLRSYSWVEMRRGWKDL